MLVRVLSWLALLARSDAGKGRRDSDAASRGRRAPPHQPTAQRKLGENKTPNEARRALKRRLANVIYRQLLKDQHRPISPGT
jgi:hypothetical protein